MADPWKTLGVKPGASDEEIKRAYHDLVKKYHPDRFQDAAARELANEKLKEINQAYGEVTGGGASRSQGSASYSQDYTASGSQRFQQVRQNLQQQRVDEAERTLDQMSDHNAEWHFLRGVCYSFRGWYAMARENIAMAVNMEPGNMEYRNALNQLDNSAQFSGPFGQPFGQPYAQGRGGMGGAGGCSMCDICSCMLCTDCLCNSCGGC